MPETRRLCAQKVDVMKKKPPPGATLIARLKEQRLAREAELARKQAAAEGQPDADTTNEPAEPPKPQSSAEKNQPEKTARVIAKHATSDETTDVSVEAADQLQTEMAQAPAGNRQTVVVSTRVRNRGANLALPEAPVGNLLHREIDIDDLRPTTDDYSVLTDEIRLAGRFAAVGLIAQGLRLYRLREDQIYKNHYQTFEDYCRKEHQMSATYAYRLIRMAEMAERIAQVGQSGQASATENMPDPFEVMIGLGHRHLMALLPLEVETAQELLVRGIPVQGEDNGTAGDERVPISRATEKQIRQALKVFSPGSGKTAIKVVEKKSLASEKQLIPALNKLVEMLEDWSLWLGGDAPPELQAARMGRGQLLNRLAKRFRAASGRIADALEGTEE
jgi:hypothetical protein